MDDMIEPLEWCPSCESSKYWLYEQQSCLACGYEPKSVAKEFVKADKAKGKK